MQELALATGATEGRTQACLDRAPADSLGACPVAPALEAGSLRQGVLIEATRLPKDTQRMLHMHMLGPARPF